MNCFSLSSLDREISDRLIEVNERKSEDLYKKLPCLVCEASASGIQTKRGGGGGAMPTLTNRRSSTIVRRQAQFTRIVIGLLRYHGEELWNSCLDYTESDTNPRSLIAIHSNTFPNQISRQFKSVLFLWRSCEASSSFELIIFFDASFERHFWKKSKRYSLFTSY